MGDQYNQKKETSEIPRAWFWRHILFNSTRELTSSNSVIQKLNTNLFKTHIMGTCLSRNVGKKVGDFETR